MEQAIEDAITALLKAWSDQGYSREDLKVEEEGRTITVNVETTMIYTHVLNVVERVLEVRRMRFESFGKPIYLEPDKTASGGPRRHHKRHEQRDWRNGATHFRRKGNEG